MPTIDDALRMQPEFCCSMMSTTALVQLYTPFRLTSMTRSNCSSVILLKRASCTMPALLISVSMRCHANITPSTMRAILALSVTSTWNPSASPPLLRTSASVSATEVILMSHTATLAPSLANFTAVARPMPCPPPVMMATLPGNRPYSFPCPFNPLVVDPLPFRPLLI